MWEGVQGNLSTVDPKLVFTYAKKVMKARTKSLTALFPFLGMA